MPAGAAAATFRIRVVRSLLYYFHCHTGDRKSPTVHKGDSVTNPNYIVNIAETEPSDFSGTAFSHLEIKWLVNEVKQGAQLVGVGQTVYPSNGGTHEHHLHPDAEEVVIVMSGSGWHRVGDTIYEIGPGDVVFVPRNTPHSACCTSAEDMVIIWVLGGVSSLERAGYQQVPELLP
jgi:quercetin dioxygenase-like cupin family protein